MESMRTPRRCHVLVDRHVAHFYVRLLLLRAVPSCVGFIMVVKRHQGDSTRSGANGYYPPLPARPAQTATYFDSDLHAD